MVVIVMFGILCAADVIKDSTQFLRIFGIISLSIIAILCFIFLVSQDDSDASNYENELRLQALETRVFSPTINEHLQKVIDLTDTPDYLKQVLYTRQDLINYGDQCIQTYKGKKAVKFFHEVSIFDQAKREAI